MVRRIKGGEPGAVYSEPAIRQNVGILEYSRTVQAAASGFAAGVLGLTGLYGFIFYFICAFLQSVFWLWKAGFVHSERYFIGKSALIQHSLFGGLFTYVLFWTFLYGMVHVY